MEINRPDKNVLLDFIPESVREVLEKLVMKGFSVWVVGGALRDFLLGLTPNDWDLATNASPEKVSALFSRVIPTGIKHGTVRIVLPDRYIESTSFAVSKGAGIEGDLGRRDFTMNAMALSYPDGCFVDPFGGAQDLRKGILRATGDAFVRFREDPLRTLRAGRLISVYGFDLEQETFEALKAEASGLGRVATERIRDELFKMLVGPYFVKSFEKMVLGGVVEKILPELAGQGGVQRDGAADWISVVADPVQNCPPRLRVRLAALLNRVTLVSRGFEPGKWSGGAQKSQLGVQTALSVMERLRVPHKLQREVDLIIRGLLPEDALSWSDAEIRRFLARTGEGYLEDVLAVSFAMFRAEHDGCELCAAFERFRQRVDKVLATNPPLHIRDLALSGSDVMNILNLGPGPEVGAIIRWLYELVLEDPSLNSAKFLSNLLNKRYYKTPVSGSGPPETEAQRTREEKDAG